MPSWEINFDYKISMDREVYECIVTLEAHRMVTSKIPLPPNIAKKVDRLNIVRQIKGTTGLEGNPLTEKEVANII